MPYTTIDHDVRKKLELSLNQYAICDSIYFLSRGKYCTAAKQYLGDFIGVSRRSVQDILNDLERKGLILRHKTGIETTDKWNAEVERMHSKGEQKVLTGERKPLTSREETSHAGEQKPLSEREETSHNKDFILTDYNDNDINSDKAFFRLEMRKFFSLHNDSYYYDGKEAKNIGKLLDRFKTGDELFAMMNKFLDIKKKATKEFWADAPITASSILSRVDSILASGNNKKKPTPESRAARAEEIRKIAEG